MKIKAIEALCLHLWVCKNALERGSVCVSLCACIYRWRYAYNGRRVFSSPGPRHRVKACLGPVPLSLGAA